MLNTRVSFWGLRSVSSTLSFLGWTSQFSLFGCMICFQSCQSSFITAAFNDHPLTFLVQLAFSEEPWAHFYLVSKDIPWDLLLEWCHLSRLTLDILSISPVFHHFYNFIVPSKFWKNSPNLPSPSLIRFSTLSVILLAWQFWISSSCFQLLCNLECYQISFLLGILSSTFMNLVGNQKDIHSFSYPSL